MKECSKDYATEADAQAYGQKKVYASPELQVLGKAGELTQAAEEGGALDCAFPGEVGVDQDCSS